MQYVSECVCELTNQAANDRTKHGPSSVLRPVEDEFDLRINLLIITIDSRNITHPAPVYPTYY